MFGIDPDLDRDHMHSHRFVRVPSEMGRVVMIDMADPRYAGPAERAAFADGQRSRQSEIDDLLVALVTVRDMLGSPDKYKLKHARLYLERLLAGRRGPEI